MTKEQLYDGKFDGLEVDVGVTAFSVEGLPYERRLDGRLYLRGSKWDLLPRKYDRL